MSQKTQKRKRIHDREEIWEEPYVDEEDWEEVPVRKKNVKSGSQGTRSGRGASGSKRSNGTGSRSGASAGRQAGKSSAATERQSARSGAYADRPANRGSASGRRAESRGSYGAGGSASSGRRSQGASGERRRSAEAGTVRRSRSTGGRNDYDASYSYGLYEDRDYYRTSSSGRRSTSRRYEREEEGGGLLTGIVIFTGLLILVIGCAVGYLMLQKKAVENQMADIAAIGEQLTALGDGGQGILQAVGERKLAQETEAPEEEQAPEEEEKPTEVTQEPEEPEETEEAQKPAEKTEEKPVLQDTVPFVESTTTQIGTTIQYVEVGKDKITDPSTKSRLEGFQKLAAVSGIDIYLNGSAITGGTVYVNVGESVALGAEVHPDDADEKRIAWSSMDKSTATVDKNRGIVTGVKVDDTIIVASSYDGTHEAKIMVKVREKKDMKITLNHTTATVAVGGEAHLKAKDESGGAVSVTWKSDNTKVATVAGDGTVTGKKEGKATIQAIGSGGTVLGSCVITVANNGIAVNLNKKKLELKVGESQQLSVSVTGGGAENSGIRWFSTNESVATVATNGTVTAKGAGVISVIAYSMKDENSYDYCDVTVTGDGAATVTTAAPDAKNDTVTKLKDNDGNQLYIKDSAGHYKEAVYADYYTQSKFYKKVEKKQNKYTGWHDFKGKKYYFDAKGNMITGEQVIQGVKYVFGKDGVLQE